VNLLIGWTVKASLEDRRQARDGESGRVEVSQGEALIRETNDV